MQRVVAPQHELLRVEGHVVAEVVEAQLGVGDVRDVGLVGLAPPRGVGAVLDVADLEAELAEHRPHPLGARPREVVVRGHEVAALAAERVERERQGGDERLAFARLHFGDAAVA